MLRATDPPPFSGPAGGHSQLCTRLAL